MSSTPSAGTIIDIERVEKRFGQVAALKKGIDARIREGEFFSLLGPSGCGKTTLLRMIAGLDDPTVGEIRIDGKPMNGVPANHRPTNMVFQSYAIFPHLNVFENVSYGLRKQRLVKAEVERRVAEALAMVSLSGYEKRASHAMSGGQRQRIALARALVLRPRVLLLDEPLSALDKQLREQMQIELRHLQREVGITFVLVTHDQSEALTMSDRIAVMFEGNIAQLDSPEMLYRRPISKRVASFIGVMNFFPASVTGESAKGVEAEIAGLGPMTVPKQQVPKDVTGREVTAGVRPEMMTLLFDETETAEREVMAEIDDVVYYGDMSYYSLRLPGCEELTTVSMRNTAGRPILKEGGSVRVGWGQESVVLLS